MTKEKHRPKGMGKERTHASTRATDTDPQFTDRATEVATKATACLKSRKGNSGHAPSIY